MLPDGHSVMRCVFERAVEQQDAADEAGASPGASLLILVLCRPSVEQAMSCPCRPFKGRNHAR